MRPSLFGIVLVFATLLSLPGLARAEVRIQVDVAAQTMAVYVEGHHKYSWKVSTGRGGFDTPNGVYRVTRLERDWYSREYGNAPMPYAIFFARGYAIHGTTDTKWLGRAASHGCVRLAPGHAAKLYALVTSRGANNTRIAISD